MTIDELETYIQRTGDVSPVHYLADKYLRDPAVAQQEALAKLASLAEVILGVYSTNHSGYRLAQWISADMQEHERGAAA